MPKWLRALIAGYGAKKLGGGCFSTILIFVIIYYALGQCNHPVQHGSIKTDTCHYSHPISTAWAPAPIIFPLLFAPASTDNSTPIAFWVSRYHPYR